MVSTENGIQAELTLLERKGRQHPFYWASSIESGEWANLDGKRLDTCCCHFYAIESLDLTTILA
jgi:hypothetical protein